MGTQGVHRVSQRTSPMNRYGNGVCVSLFSLMHTHTHTHTHTERERERERVRDSNMHIHCVAG